MQKLIALSILSIALIAIWFVTALMLPVTPQMYLALKAPWWHVALHVAWPLTVLAASMQGVILFYQRRSRKHFTQHPPQNA